MGIRSFCAGIGVAIAALVAPAQMSVAHADLLVGRGTALPPPAFHEFCRSYPEECRPRNVSSSPVTLDNLKIAQLRQVNQSVNRSIRQVSDLINHGREDYWTLPLSGTGDCEDIALLKRQRLIAMGWPSSALLITIVRDRRGEGHAVLSVQTDQGSFILDNKASSIRRWTNTPYSYYAKQSPENPMRWVAITNTSAGVAQVAIHRQQRTATLFRSTMPGRSLR